MRRGPQATFGMLAGLLAALLGPAAARAQEGAAGLSAPTPSSSAAPSEGPRPNATEPEVRARRAGPVPPPPSTETRVPPAYAPYAGAPSSAAPAGTTSDLGGISLDPEVASRLRILESDLNTLAARGGNRIMSGVLSMVSGAVSVSVGVLVATSTDADEFLPIYLYVFGGTTITRGLLELTLKPDFREPALAFSHTPVRSAEEAERKLRHGERTLEELADQSQLARIFDGSLATLAGASIIPIYLAPRDFKVDTFGVFIMLGASVSIVSGLVTLLLPTDAEERWGAYQELNERLAAERARARAPSTFLRIRAAASPFPHGFGVGLHGQF